MSNQATDNDEVVFSYKVSLRLETLDQLKKDVNVLDAFHGHGFVWAQVGKMNNKKINVTAIDSRSDKTNPYLRGDNEKFMLNMDLSKFDIIDVDAYGSPFKILEIILNSNFCGPVHGTFIQSVMGRINNDLLFKLGYTKKMIDKCPTLFGINGFDKLCGYLSLYGIDRVNYLDVGRKFYFYFCK
jgi:hypothetical protein